MIEQLLRLILHIVPSLFKSRARLVAEVLVLRQQLNVLCRQLSKRPQLSNSDRFLFRLAYRWFPSVLGAIATAGNDHPLASHGVPVVLARAVTQPGWQAENLGRAAQSHRRDEPRKSPLGCTTHSRAYYNDSRIHRSLDKDAPFHRAIERFGVITPQPVLGGLHHQYCRI
jgi:hypothetical protein